MMRNIRRPAGRTSVIVAALAVLLALGGVLATAAPPENGDAHEEDEPLAGPAEFTDDVAVQIRDGLGGRGTDVINLRDASNVIVDEASVPPGAVLPWHNHPGPLLILVAEGEFTYVLADDCVHRAYHEGEALIDPGDRVHTAYNPQEDEDTVLVAVYLGVPDDGELTTPVDAETAQDLDQHCDIDTPSPQ